MMQPLSNLPTCHLFGCGCDCWLPQVLQLKRFRAGFYGKVNKHISFQPTLNFRPFCSVGSVEVI